MNRFNEVFERTSVLRYKVKQNYFYIQTLQSKTAVYRHAYPVIKNFY